MKRKRKQHKPKKEGGSSWQDIDKLVSEDIKLGKIHPKRWENTAVTPITAVGYKDTIGEKWPHEKWLTYSTELLELIDKVKNKEVVAKWDMIKFRSEEDFRAGIFSDFVQFWPIVINQMGCDKNKQIAYKMIHWGLSASDNQGPIAVNKPVNFRNKTKLCTESKINQKYLEVKNLMGIPTQQQEFEMCGTTYNINAYYPAQSIWKNGLWVKQNYRQSNQNKILENVPIMHEQLLKWIEQGVIEYLGPINEIDPKIVTSLVLANKEGTDIYRICFDGGSYKATQKYNVPCQLDTVHDALQQMEKGDYLSKLDDKSGFLQCKFDDSSQELTTIRWGKHFFKFFGAIFGLGRVPADFQMVNNCAVSYLRAAGVPITLYLDDRLVIEKGITAEQIERIRKGEEAPPNIFITMALIIALGGFISRKKSTFICDTRIEFLGFIIDTILQTVEIPAEKWERLQHKIKEIIAMGICSYKELEKLRGYMCSMILVITNLRLYIRIITEKLVEADNNNSTEIKVDNRLKLEFKIWIDQNKYIKTIRPWIEKDMLEIPTIEISTDASGAAGGWVEPDGTERTVYWDKKYEKSNIAVKEALAILLILQQRPSLFTNKRVIFNCDNKSVEYAFNVGARNPELNDIIREINMKCIDLNCLGKIKWVDTLSQKADKASRTMDYKEEILNEKIYKKLKSKLELEVNLDGMATFFNKKENRYISHYQEDYAIHKNFLIYTPIPSDVIYLFPPKNMAPIVANKMYRETNKFILIFHVISEIPFFVSCRPRDVNFDYIEKLIGLPKQIPITLLPCKKETKWGYKTENKKSGKIAIIYRK